MSVVGTLSDDEAVAVLEQAAGRLFDRDGVVGVTVSSIRDESGLSMRRIYRLCPSKADLVSLWLRHRHTTWMRMVSEQVAEQVAAGVGPVDAVFDVIGRWLVETDFRGCGFLNTLAESSELTAEHLDIIQSHKRAVAWYLDQVIGQGDAVALLVDGAIVQAAVHRNLGPVEQARELARAFIIDRLAARAPSD